MQFRSYQTLRRGYWTFKVSILGTDNILVVMYNEITFETFARSFVDDLDANLFIEYILNKNSIEDEKNE